MNGKIAAEVFVRIVKSQMLTVKSMEKKRERKNLIRIKKNIANHFKRRGYV